jgi:2-dehydropantoate 2-reductase
MPHPRRSGEAGDAARRMREAVAVGRAKGVGLAAGYAENRLAFCDTLSAATPSSMSVDLERGHRLELPWLSGTVVDLGAALNVSTPVNQRIVEAHAPYVDARN